MEAPLRNYDLPDIALLRGSSSAYGRIAWQPAAPILVLGYGNSPDDSLHLEAVREDGLPVMRRPSGGEAVLLTPAMAAVSVRIPGQAPPRRLFAACGARLIAALASLGLPGAVGNGISDICLDGRKVSGSSIYRGRGRTLFHAVVNVAEDPRLLARYLRHPAREPEYRGGRPHADFVTSLAAAGFRGGPREVVTALEEAFSFPFADFTESPDADRAGGSHEP